MYGIIDLTTNTTWWKKGLNCKNPFGLKINHKSILEHQIQYLKSRGITKVYLCTSGTIPALSAYKSVKPINVWNIEISIRLIPYKSNYEMVLKELNLNSNEAVYIQGLFLPNKVSSNYIDENTPGVNFINTIQKYYLTNIEELKKENNQFDSEILNENIIGENTSISKQSKIINCIVFEGVKITKGESFSRKVITQDNVINPFTGSYTIRNSLKKVPGIERVIAAIYLFCMALPHFFLQAFNLLGLIKVDKFYLDQETYFYDLYKGNKNLIKLFKKFRIHQYPLFLLVFNSRLRLLGLGLSPIDSKLRSIINVSETLVKDPDCEIEKEIISNYTLNTSGTFTNKETLRALKNDTTIRRKNYAA